MNKQEVGKKIKSVVADAQRLVDALSDLDVAFSDVTAEQLTEALKALRTIASNGFVSVTMVRGIAATALKRISDVEKTSTVKRALKLRSVRLRVERAVARAAKANA